MLTLTNKEFEKISNILDGYVMELNELDISSEEYKNLKEKLDNQFCGLRIFGEKQILHAELDLGNVMINADILTCIFGNAIHKFKMVKRKAMNGEYAYIVSATDCEPFNTKCIGRCFKVHKQPTKEDLGWIVDHVSVNLEDLDAGWCLYDDQYVVLEEIV